VYRFVIPPCVWANFFLKVYLCKCGSSFVGIKSPARDPRPSRDGGPSRKGKPMVSCCLEEGGGPGGSQGKVRASVRSLVSLVLGCLVM
jgi:hypothetical protein